MPFKFDFLEFPEQGLVLRVSVFKAKNENGAWHAERIDDNYA